MPNLVASDDVVAPAAERPPEQLLAGARAVGVRGVEQGDAGVEGGVDDRLRLLGVDAGAEGVGAEADGGDHQAAVAEGTVGHVAHEGKVAGLSSEWHGSAHLELHDHLVEGVVLHVHDAGLPDREPLGARALVEVDLLLRGGVHVDLA